ncbi:MAG: hypothetical protein R3B57_06570 [Phycisphaerales bacterium]
MSEPQTQAPGGYRPLTGRAKTLIAVMAGLIAGASLLAGVYGWATFSQNSRITPEEYRQVEHMYELTRTNTAHDTFILVHNLNLLVQVRRVLNEQALNAVALGGATALLAIGFALFVIGIDGAFTVHGTAGTQGSVVLQGSAPGLLCFTLAAGLLALAMVRDTPLKIGSGQLPGNLPLGQGYVEALGAFTGGRFQDGLSEPEPKAPASDEELDAFEAMFGATRESE